MKSVIKDKKSVSHELSHQVSMFLWFLTTVIGSIHIPCCRCSWMVSWSSSPAWRIRLRWYKPSSWIRRWVDGKRMGKSWLVYGWTWRNAHWTYIYIPNMGYDSDEMLKDDIISLMVNDVWWISFIIIFCHIWLCLSTKNIRWNDDTWLYNDGRELISQSPASIVLFRMGNMWMNQLIRFMR